MTRRKQTPEVQRLFLTAAMSNPALREVEAEHSRPATLDDVGQCLLFGSGLAVAGWLAALGIAALWIFPGLTYFMPGVCGAAGMAGWALYIAHSHRVRQWAAFDEPHIEPQPGREFVPIADGSRTLVPDTALRRKIIRFAELLPSVGYSLAYRQWTGRGRLFSRGEFEQVRAALVGLTYEEAGQVTQAGRNAIGRWRLGNFTPDENDRLRGE